MKEKTVFNEILDEICEEKNIKQEELSFGWIRKLSKENKSHYLIRHQFDLNSSISNNLANDKYATYEILKGENIPTIPHKMFFNPATRPELYDEEFEEEIDKLLSKYSNKVIVKANDSYEGRDVYYCTNKKEILDAIKNIFNGKNDNLSICPFVEIEYEYRVIYFFGEILFAYKKRKPFVVGNGKSTIKELINIREENENIHVTPKNDLDLNYIPENGEEVTVSWKHNLYGGAIPISAENDEYIDEIKKVAKKAGDALNIGFSSVDVALTNDKKIFIMELNATVCMSRFSKLFENGKEITKAIFSKAIDKMFE